jgi:hypothetical protein
MPVSRVVIAFFIMLGSGAMGLGSKLVVLSSFPVQIVHNTSLQRKERHRSRQTPGVRPFAAGPLGMNTEHFEKLLLRNKELQCIPLPAGSAISSKQERQRVGAIISPGIPRRMSRAEEPPKRGSSPTLPRCLRGSPDYWRLILSKDVLMARGRSTLGQGRISQ